MSAGSCVHHARLGIGQVQRIAGTLAIVRFARGTFEVSTNTLGKVHAS